MSWAEGYMEIDATKTPIEGRGIFVVAKNQYEAEARLQGLLQAAEVRAELGLHLPPQTHDHLCPPETCIDQLLSEPQLKP
jgi:hypothetical protein